MNNEQRKIFGISLLKSAGVSALFGVATGTLQGMTNVNINNASMEDGDDADLDFKEDADVDIDDIDDIGAGSDANGDGNGGNTGTGADSNGDTNGDTNGDRSGDTDADVDEKESKNWNSQDVLKRQLFPMAGNKDTISWNDFFDKNPSSHEFNNRLDSNLLTRLNALDPHTRDPLYLGREPVTPGQVRQLNNRFWHQHQERLNWRQPARQFQPVVPDRLQQAAQAPQATQVRQDPQIQQNHNYEEWTPTLEGAVTGAVMTYFALSFVINGFSYSIQVIAATATDPARYFITNYNNQDATEIFILDNHYGFIPLTINQRLSLIARFRDNDNLFAGYEVDHMINNYLGHTQITFRIVDNKFQRFVQNVKVRTTQSVASMTGFQVGRIFGKPIGQTVGQSVAKKFSEQAVEKLSTNGLKCMPFVSVGVSVVMAVKNVKNHHDQGLHMGKPIAAGMVDVGTSLLGWPGMIINVVAQSALDVFMAE